MFSWLRFMLAALAVAAAPIPAVAADADPTDTITLLARLDADYQHLLAAEKHPQPIRDAAAFLASTNQNSHWTDYSKAVELIRQHRSRASIPLLMKYMMLHESFGSSHIIIPAYADTMAMLAGEKIDIGAPAGRDRQTTTESAVLNLYLNWWKPRKNILITDLSLMSDEQIKFVVSELIRHSQYQLSPVERGRTVDVQTLFEKVIQSKESKSGRQEWYPEELNKRMLPMLLESAGYVAQPTENPTTGDAAPEFAVVPLLAELRHRGEAPTLDKTALDPRQNNITRLTCMLAIQSSGDRLHSEPVLGIYSTDTRVNCRVLALLTLSLCDKNAATVPKLVAALDDDNSEIRLAALRTLREVNPRAALPKLTLVLHDGSPEEMILPGIMMLGSIGGDASSAVLVDYMQRAMADGGRRAQSNLSRALISFTQTTGKNWIEAGAHQPEYYQGQAKAAVAWWKSKHP